MKNKIIFATRVAAAILAVLGLVVFIEPMIVSSIYDIGNYTGVVICLWGLCVSIKPIHTAIKSLFGKTKPTKVLLHVLNCLMTAFLIYGLVVTSAMVYCALQPPLEGSTAIVLGAKVNGSEPSSILRERINAAESFLNDNPNSRAVLSGGKGSDEDISEAECMYNVMVADGIDGSRLYIEDKSTTTKENLEFSRAVIESNSINSEITIVTDGFHQLRADITASKIDCYSKVGAKVANTKLWYLPTYVVREWFAVPKQVLF